MVKRVAGVHSIYRSADGGEPVAPVRRQPPPGGSMRSLGRNGFPEAVLAHLSGLPVRRRRGTRSPGKASAATGESMRSLGGYGFPEAVLAHLSGLPVRRRQ